MSHRMSIGWTVDLCKKKKALSDEDFEKEYGRHWIWAALDPESKLLINFFIGQRTLEDCRAFIGDLVRRIRTKPLFTSDELPHYQTALMEHFSRLQHYPKTGKRGRPKKPIVVIDPELQYATVHKTRDNAELLRSSVTLSSAIKNLSIKPYKHRKQVKALTLLSLKDQT